MTSALQFRHKVHNKNPVGKPSIPDFTFILYWSQGGASLSFLSVSLTTSHSLPLLIAAQSLLLNCDQSLFCPPCNLIAPAHCPCKISERKTGIWLDLVWALSVSQTTLIGSRPCRAMSHATLPRLRQAWESCKRETKASRNGVAMGRKLLNDGQDTTALSFTLRFSSCTSC